MVFESYRQKMGFFYAIAAFGLWGLVPLYYKSLQHVLPLEILAHRVAWSAPLTLVLIAISRDWGALRKAISSRRVITTLVLSSMLVVTNWFIFIYAIHTNRVLQASLGYFINPLVNVLLGIVLLKERLQTLKIAAVLLAAAGTINLALSYGRLPWISLALAFSFGFYGYLRKNVEIESVNGLFIETSLIFPLAFFYILIRGLKGQGAFGAIDWQTTLLLVSAGAVTTFPLVWFTCATRRLQYATIGIIQYLTPTLQFLLAVFYYKEPFSSSHIITFCLIWSGLGIFMADSLFQLRRHKIAYK
ncbi:MAG: EamA family transporter RarD [Deltaproteobacteria bacterium]|nr:EamA family transporter RarD [Deltaproteobacteria bacterium]